MKPAHYTRGFHLALYDKPLFDEDILAWEHGPVVRSLWHRYQKYGSKAIPVPKEVNFKVFTPEPKELLDEVY